ncbi:hypothetical protein [Streptomyces sp. NBC_00009]|uniref:hypothetical protein n=1 Tax=Streptomyces sp. NBC_00009 TaxID=2975620 RepID=UPI0038636F4E
MSYTYVRVTTLPSGVRCTLRSSQPSASSSRKARAIRISPSSKCARRLFIVMGAPSGSEKMYAATPTVMAEPLRWSRRLVRTVKFAVWRTRMWMTPEEGTALGLAVAMMEALIFLSW